MFTDVKFGGAYTAYKKLEQWIKLTKWNSVLFGWYAENMMMRDLRSCLMALGKETRVSRSAEWQPGRWALYHLGRWKFVPEDDSQNAAGSVKRLCGQVSAFPDTGITGFPSLQVQKKKYPENHTEETMCFKQMWLSLDRIFNFLMFSLAFKNYTEETAYLKQIGQYRVWVFKFYFLF